MTHSQTVPDETREAIDGAERPPAAWEDDNSTRAREEWDGTAAHQRARDRATQRATRTLGARLDAAINRMAVISGIPAARIGSEPRGSDHDDPRPAGGEDPASVVENELRLIEAQVRRVEELVDTETGIARPTSLSGDAKDKVIWEEYQGIRADQVAQAAPWLGTSARTIERARKREADKRHLIVRLVTGEIIRPMTPYEAERLQRRGY